MVVKNILFNKIKLSLLCIVLIFCNTIAHGNSIPQFNNHVLIHSIKHTVFQQALSTSICTENYEILLAVEDEGIADEKYNLPSKQFKSFHNDGLFFRFCSKQKFNYPNIIVLKSVSIYLLISVLRL